MLVKRLLIAAMALPLLMFGATSQAKPRVDRAFALQQSASRARMLKLKSEVLTSFTLYGQPVSPKAVREFASWESDLLSPIVAIDLNATVDSNHYCGDISKRDGNIVMQSDCLHPDYAKTDYIVLGHVGKDNVVVNSFDESRLPDFTVLVLHISLQTLNFYGKTQYMVVARPVAKFNVSNIEAKLDGGVLIDKTASGKVTKVDLLKAIQS